MHAMTIRKIDDDMKQSLAARAASNQRSMEAEARNILRTALVPAKRESLGEIARRIFGPENGFDDFPEIPLSEARPAVFEE